MIPIPPSKAVADYIVANVSGYSLGVNLFVGLMPEDPGSAVCVYDAPQGGTVFTQNASYDAVAAGVQVVSRAMDYETAWTSVGNIADAIRSSGIYIISGAAPVSGAAPTWQVGPAVPQGGPIPLGWDHRNRYSFSQSFRLFHQQQ